MKQNIIKKKVNISGGGFRRLLINILAGVGVLILVMMIININRSKEETIDIVQVSEDIYPNQLITDSVLTKYSMVRREYDNHGGDYLLWDDREEAINNYSSVFVKRRGHIVKGDYMEYKPSKNPWMEEASDGDIFITLPYNRAQAFGNILTPGDSVKVNVSYEEEKQVNDELYGASTSRVLKTETLFNSIKITDLLNSSGNSIYDYYTDLLNLPLSQREALLRDENFLSNVSPVSMVLKINDQEEFFNYSAKTASGGLTYTFGLLPRKEGDIVIDQFTDITRQISKSISQSYTKQGEE